MCHVQVKETINHLFLICGISNEIRNMLTIGWALSMSTMKIQCHTTSNLYARNLPVKKMLFGKICG